ncbi:MAG: hypothetical protein WC865_13750 [Bacteroidales bacterium]
MANNPLQKFGLIKVSDIMKEKEWIGNESKTLTALVTGNDKNVPYVVLNTYNPLVMRTGITTKPYSISEWYGYNHALTEDPTQLNATITGGNMRQLTKGSSESGAGLGMYVNHFEVLNNNLANATSGSATTKSSGDDTFLDIWTRFQVANVVTGGRGAYNVDNSRGYLQINLSTVSTMRVVSKAEILLTCVSNTYTPCKTVLVKYEGGSPFVDYPYYPYSLVISEPVLFSTGEQTFTLNAAGIAYLNEKIVSADKYLRIGIITYEYDYLQEAYLGDNLLQGDDAIFATSGNWIVTSGYGTGSLQDEITPDQKTRKVLKILPTTSESIRVSISNTYFLSVPTTGVNYFFHCYYRFGQFPTSFDPAGFSGSTYAVLNGKQLGTYSAGLNANLIKVDDPTGKSPEWQRGHHFGTLDSPGYTNDNKLSFSIGNASNANYAVNEFAIANVKIMNPVFTKTFGGKYNTPKLKYYYDGYPGAVTTGSVSGVTATQATLGGTVTTDGRTVISVSGLCWNTTGNPTTADSKTTDGGTSVAGFSSTATGLTLGQTYYIRPYVTTEVGTYYGTQTSFTTLGLPTVGVSITIDVTTTSVTLRGGIIADGGQSITDRGFVYKIGTSGEPAITDNKGSATVPTGTTNFTRSLTGLSPGTTYRAKSYATNASGTVLCSSYDEFTTLANLPTVTTDTSVQSLTSSSCYLNGNVSSDGGASVSTKGICYNTTGTPTTANPTVASGTGTGSISSSLTGLSRATIYYARAYATNSQGTAYGSQISFTTLAVVPTVSATTSASGITQTSASSGGNVTDDGGSTITQRGICWGTSSNPTTANSKVTATGTTGTFSAGLTSLTASTTYYVRAYATNGIGTSYGTQVSFTTSSASTIPTVTTTSPATSISSTGATVAGNVSADGGASVTEKGICYSTSASPTTSSSKVTSGTGTGSISSVLSGLASGTTYHCRAYAITARVPLMVLRLISPRLLQLHLL